MSNLFCKGDYSFYQVTAELYQQGYRSEHVSEIMELGYSEVEAILIGKRLGYIEIQFNALERKHKKVK